MNKGQIGFFDEENQYEKLTELGNPPEKLNDVMDWEIFRGELTRVCQKEDYRKGGRPPIDVIVKFKASVLKRIYNLSYDQTEYQINDRLSFMRFLGLGLNDKVLDAKTLWDFENTLANADMGEKLFCMFDEVLEKEGLITHKGTIVDATFVDAPHTQEELNACLRLGYIVQTRCQDDGEPVYAITPVGKNYRDN